MDTPCHTVVSCLVVEDAVLCRVVDLVEEAEDLKETSRSSSTNKQEMLVPHQALRRPLPRLLSRCHSDM